MSRRSRPIGRLHTIALLTALAIVLPVPSSGQDRADWNYAALSDSEVIEVRASVEAMKERARGPFERIRWFCADGTVLPPRPYACREHGGGRQHGEYTAVAKDLHELGFHVGPVLAAVDWEAFFDLANSHYYLRELVLQRFLENADDGWVMRRARYYRGGRQAENEEAQGRMLLEQLLSDGDWVRRNYLLAVEVARAVPHGTPGIAGDEARGLALQIADADPDFMPLRIKIHSSPSAEDLPAVRDYLADLPADDPQGIREMLERLESALAATYSTGADDGTWERLATDLPPEIAEELLRAPDAQRRGGLSGRALYFSQLLRSLRRAIESAAGAGDGKTALALVDALHVARSNAFRETNAWSRSLVGKSSNRTELTDAAFIMLWGAYGSGWLTEREYTAVTARLEADLGGLTLTRSSYLALARYLGRSVEWGTAAAKQMIALAEQRYAPVEPLAHRFSDDAVRGSVLLPLATILNRIEADAATEAGLSYNIDGEEVATGLMGLNPGVALGKLYLIEDPADLHGLDPEGIYVLPETPADLGRLAGILTIDQGSRLSHVQLLARGLGIPNAAIASVHLDSVRAMEGREVVYAVSPLGSVLLEPAEKLSATTLEQFRAGRETTRTKVTIDAAQLDLDARRILPLESIEAADSGHLAGPKAANLGQLHQLFPDRVAPGAVIPFGIFRAHIDRDLDGDGRTLYEETVDIYESEASPAELARQLAGVADKIRSMPLIPRFERELLATMRARFELAGVDGVFVRSDTNVEDLPGFSGAGLNLTVMNVTDEQHLLQAIRDVWAFPYRERSFVWRQQVITNPDAVYPSIVLLGSVEAAASGVLVTRDIDGALMGAPDLGPEDGWTATLAAGVGGAVEGESTETVLLPATPGAFDPILLSSARAAWRKSLDPDGGIRDLPVFGDTTLLTPARLADLNAVMREILDRYPDEAGDTPWDIEFGFVGDSTVLFQIRPFVVGDTALPELQAMDADMLAGAQEPVSLAGVAR